MALAAHRAGVASEDDAGLTRICQGLDLVFDQTGTGTRLLMNREDVSGFLRTPEMSMMASAVSARPVVREYLLGIQKKMGREKEAVFEGRDMGTVVFPDAEMKFFLDASPKIRAERRYREISPTTSVTLEEVERDIIRRDKNDSTRAVAPLRPAQDAVIIDSTEFSIDEVVVKMTQNIYRKANCV